MAIGPQTQWNVRSSATASDVNGGGFNPGNTNMATDGAATSATGNSPVFSSASYNFVAGDVGAWVFIKSGTNWTPGWYEIASVASNVATLKAAVGEASLYGVNAPSCPGVTGVNTVAGAATTGSPTGATWSVDYSKQDAAQISYTDMVVDATFNNQFTSAGNPVGKNIIGNIINVTSGSGFTVQRIEVVSTVTTTATADRAIGNLSSTGGNGKLGGAFITVGASQSAATLGLAGTTTHVKSGTYSGTATLVTFLNSGDSTNGPVSIRGYGTIQGDGGTEPVLTSATNSIIIINLGGKNKIRMSNLKITHTASTRGPGIQASAGAGASNGIVLDDMIIDGCSIGIYGDNISPFDCRINATNVEIKNCTSDGLKCPVLGIDLNIHNNSGDGVGRVGITSFSSLTKCLIYSNGGDGVDNTNGNIAIDKCTIHGNTGSGIRVGDVAASITNNIITSNGAYGIDCPAASGNVYADYNAFRSNTSGARNNLIAGPHDITLTADPYTNAGTDFTLNNTAGGGAACRAVGIPGTVPGATGTGYPDLGVYQHQDSGGGASTHGFGFVG